MILQQQSKKKKNQMIKKKMVVAMGQLQELQAGTGGECRSERRDWPNPLKHKSGNGRQVKTCWRAGRTRGRKLEED